MIFDRTCVRIEGDEKNVEIFSSEDSFSVVNNNSYIIDWYNFGCALLDKNVKEVLENIKVSEYYISGRWAGKSVPIYYPTTIRINGYLSTSTWAHGITIRKVSDSWFRQPMSGITVDWADLITDFRRQSPIPEGTTRDRDFYCPRSGYYTPEQFSKVEKNVIIRRYWDYLSSNDQLSIWKGSSVEDMYGDLKALKEVYYDL